MPNPFAALEPALRVIADGAQVLPATGQAQEYLQRFDIDEYYDRIRTKDDKVLRDFHESPNNRLYVSLEPLGRTTEHVFRYFVDGSVKTYFLGTAVVHDQSTPILLGQAGAAVVRREDPGTVHIHKASREIIILADRGILTDVVWRKLEALEPGLGPVPLRVLNTKDSDPYSEGGEDGEHRERRSRAAHKANWRMRELEKEALRKLLTDHHQTGHWLVVDGGLGKEFKEKAFERGFVGVVKNFSKDQSFEITSRGQTVRFSLYELLAKLDVNQRTAVFARDNGHVAFWYVRIREQRYMDYPLMGVIKIEIPNPRNEIVSSVLADRLSRALLSERSVSAHGRDPRWHAHLYPIFLAEQVIKTGFYSEEVLRAGIKWPRLVTGS
ncbi:MAG: hypothetical protein ACE5JQ_00895 [Candidatus Methylomirabilales bacterium]